MSAETLRRASASMRERAEAAAAGTDDPWYGNPDTVSLGVPLIDAEHIASWHPAVAVAVADWLEYEAGCVERNQRAQFAPALAVARAYLGES